MMVPAGGAVDETLAEIEPYPARGRVLVDGVKTSTTPLVVPRTFPGRGSSWPRTPLLTFRIQPDGRLSLCVEVKVRGIDLRVATARMDFSYAGEFGPFDHSAYETLLVDCMVGEATLFTRSDGVDAAWRVVDPILEAWGRSGPASISAYAAGAWGSAEAEELITHDGARWRTL